MAIPPIIDGLTPICTLGSGGFADVWQCQQTQPNRMVAVKVLRQAVGQVDLFHEANMVAQLQHPNIVSVFATGLALDGRAYLTMPMLSPDTLGTRLRNQPLSLAETLQIGIQIAGAVATAHEHQVLHRDIKPANILFDQYSIPLLCDFGISAHAQLAHLADGSLSVPWAAPEIIRGSSPPSPQSDIYALGITLWEALHGGSPFYAPNERLSLDELATRIINNQRRCATRTDLPIKLRQLLESCLAANPNQRPRSAADLSLALQDVEYEADLPPTRAVFPGSKAPGRPGDKRVTQSLAGPSSLMVTHLRPPSTATSTPRTGTTAKARSATSTYLPMIIMLLVAALVFGGFKLYERFGPTLTPSVTKTEPLTTPTPDISMDGVGLAEVPRSQYLKTSVGECLRIPASGAPISVGCQEANAKSVFGIAQIIQAEPDREYDQLANRWCTAKYQKTISPSFEAGAFAFLYPTTVTWAQGDRFIVCLK